jgi:hypothetical protein
VFDQALRLPTDHRAVELAVLAGLSGLIGFLAIGVVRRWRWTYWLILVAFLFGVLRVPAAVLQFTGILATNTPTWYVTFQALLGVVQFGIGLVMVVGYRRSGAWGRSERCRGTGLIAHTPPDARRPSGRWRVDHEGLKHRLAGSGTMLWCLRASWSWTPGQIRSTAAA